MSPREKLARRIAHVVVAIVACYAMYVLGRMPVSEPDDVLARRSWRSRISRSPRGASALAPSSLELKRAECERQGMDTCPVCGECVRRSEWGEGERARCPHCGATARERVAAIVQRERLFEPGVLEARAGGGAAAGDERFVVAYFEPNEALATRMRDAGASVIALELEGEGGRGGRRLGGGGDDDDDDGSRGGARPSRKESADAADAAADAADAAADAADAADADDDDAGPLIADLTGRGDCFPANKMRPNECLPMYSGVADGVVILDELQRLRDATFAVVQLGRVVRDGGWMQTSAPCRAGGGGGGGEVATRYACDDFRAEMEATGHFVCVDGRSALGGVDDAALKWYGLFPSRDGTAARVDQHFVCERVDF
jgi:hypothetical protein